LYEFLVTAFIIGDIRTREVRSGKPYGSCRDPLAVDWVAHLSGYPNYRRQSNGMPFMREMENYTWTFVRVLHRSIPARADGWPVWMDDHKRAEWEVTDYD